jgi:hypothetical protein
MAFIADELAKLAELKKSGTLTEEEFQSQKSRLLGAGEEPAAPPQAAPSASPKVVESLKKYSSSHTSKCGSCGYDGPMGVVRTDVLWYGSWPFIIFSFAMLALVALAFPISGFISIIIGMFLASLRTRGKNHHLACPSCDKRLQTNPT